MSSGWTSFIPSERAAFSESSCCLQNSGQHTKSRYRAILIRPNNNESKLVLGTFEVSLTAYTHTKTKTDVQTLYAVTNFGKADKGKQVNCRLTDIGNVLTKTPVSIQTVQLADGEDSERCAT
jgi:hypothetical protein